MAPRPWRVVPAGLELTVRVTPNAGADRIEGVEQRADGDACLRLRVAAAPDRGKANAAVAALLGRALGVPKSSIVLVAGGETARIKRLRLAGDGAALAGRLEALVGS
jgi:uncharacterized protein YggU (UPF0235/DUF167 family)